LTLPFTGPCVNFATNQPPGGTVGSINGVLELSTSLALATTQSGYVLTFAGQGWSEAGGGLPSNLPFVSLDGPDQTSVFVANADQIFVTHDLGNTWQTASDQLPSTVNATELHYVLQPDNQAYMYLSTYGWAMFRAPLN
jgi:hypothetical protein